MASSLKLSDATNGFASEVEPGSSASNIRVRFPALTDHDHGTADLGHPRGAHLDDGSLDLSLRVAVYPDHRGRELEFGRVELDRGRADLDGDTHVAFHGDALTALDRNGHALELDRPVAFHDEARLPGCQRNFVGRDQFIRGSHVDLLVLA